MKKLLALVSVVAVVGTVSTASAVDRAGSFALGFQEQFTSGGTYGTTAGAWSLKYGVTSNVTGQLVVGFDIINKGGNNSANFGGRLLYDLVENENSDFYTGLGFGYQIDDVAGDALRIMVPLGMEFAFSGLPEVGISAEVGFIYDYLMDLGDASRISSVGGTVGGNLGLGVHYYF